MTLKQFQALPEDKQTLLCDMVQGYLAVYGVTMAADLPIPVTADVSLHMMEQILAAIDNFEGSIND